MPTYEYRCAEGHRFELFQRMSEEPGAICPECGAASERLLSAGAGFLFKGDGFYITDYRSEDYRKAAKADEGSGKVGDKKEGASSPSSESSQASTKKSSGAGDAQSGGGGAKKSSGTGGSDKSAPSSKSPSSD